MDYRDDILTGLQEHMDFHYSSESESDRGEALALGAEYPERAWILTDRDVWHPNPYYSGPPRKHPEDDSDDYRDYMPLVEKYYGITDMENDDIPFLA